MEGDDAVAENFPCFLQRQGINLVGRLSLQVGVQLQRRRITLNLDLHTRTQIARPPTIQKGCKSFRPAVYE